MLLKIALKIGRHRRVIMFVWLALMFVLEWSNPSTFGQSESTGAGHYRVFTLRYISPEQGRKYLADANTGTISHLPGTNSLLATASPENLIKISTILNLVDTNEPYVVKPIGPASRAGEIPSVEKIAAKVRNISIGTFFNPPGTTGPTAKAIIDVLNDNVFVVAPAGRTEEILSAIAALQNPATDESAKVTQMATAAELNDVVNEQKPLREPNTLQPDELFNGLLNSLAEAEGRAVKSAVPQDSAPQSVTSEETTVSAAEPNLPAEKSETAEPGEKLPAKAEPESLPQQDVVEQAKQITPPAPARLLYEPEPLGDSNETLELDLPETLKLIDLLDLVGKYLHLDYLYDAVSIQNIVVNLKVQGPIKVTELYPLLESVLRFRNFAMTRKGNLVTLAPSVNMLDYDPALIDPQTGKVRYGDLVITRVFQLKYADTGSATNLLNNMKLGAIITPIPETGTLIVTGYTFRMERIEQLLAMIDKPGRPKQFKFRQLRYTMAKILAPKVKTLIEQLGTISITVGLTEGPEGTPGRPVQPRTRPGPQPMPQPQPAPAPAGESAKPTVYLDADERTNRILMIGQELELKVVDELINALDVEQADLRTLRVYEIQNVDAGEVRNKLAEMGIVGGGAGAGYGRAGEGRISRTIYERTPGAVPGAPAPTPTPAAAAAAAGGAELLAEEPQVVVIESINALLVNGTSEQHLRIATIIGYLDQATIQKAINYVIYPLENQKPTDLAEVLNKLIQETIKDEKGKVEKIVKRQEEDIIIVPDENTFSLIVYASKKNQEWIANLIKTLDRRRPQVLIDVTLVEVSKTDTFDYDLKLISSIPDLTATSGLTQSLMGDDVNGTNKVARLTSSGRERFIDFQSNKTKGGLGFYADKHINALLTAMQTKSYGRILAKPKILVNDNEKGRIEAKDTTYVQKQSSIPLSTGTGNVINTVTTAIDYQPYDAGITMDITPHISEGELLRLEIGLTRSDFDPATLGGIKPPDTSSSDLVTVVTVPDGSTIILGGLVKLKQGKGGSKVPLLGDIPLIGAAFRTVSNTDTQKKIYIFVKAEILRPESTAYAKGDLVKISDRNREAFEKQEREFQDYNDVPGTKPQPMDPARVLEAE